MNLILFDDSSWQDLLPLTYTRPSSSVLCGTLTIQEKWEHELGSKASHITRKHLSSKFGLTRGEDNLLVKGNLLPDSDLVDSSHKLEIGQALKKGEQVLAARVSETQLDVLFQMLSKGVWKDSEMSVVEYSGEIRSIDKPWDIFQNTGEEISADIRRLDLQPNSTALTGKNTVLGDQLYVANGVKAQACIFNAESGPIVLDEGAEVMEGSVIRGPFYLGKSSTLKLSTKVYGPTSIGPHCKVGGEVTNIVMFGYSNKGHDGFIGNSVIGEWCNFGADTNSSNLKNNYSKVRVWSYREEKAVESGLQFVGLIAGDHSKTGINTMLNTGTVLGVSANVFGGDFPPKFIPSFSWGGARGFDTFKINKAFEVAEAMMGRRGIELSDADKAILQHVFLADSLYRQ